MTYGLNDLFEKLRVTRVSLTQHSLVRLELISLGTPRAHYRSYRVSQCEDINKKFIFAQFTSYLAKVK